MKIGEYRLIRHIGRGGMGVVYLARDTFLDRNVAVKFIGHVNPDPATRARILKEARTAARIQHPNVVATYRIGDHDNIPYIVSEYVRGTPLSKLSIPVPWQQVLELGMQLARGLEAAHRHGVLHLDIKPGNVILSEDGSVKLLDFGLAQFIDQVNRIDRSGEIPTPIPHPDQAPASRPQPELSGSLATSLETNRSQTVVVDVPLEKSRRPDAATPSSRSHADPPTSEPTPTQTPAPSGADQSPGFLADTLAEDSNSSEVFARIPHKKIWGTPRYIAPETWLGRPATPSADLYALGVMLYQLCSGKTPFHRTHVDRLTEVTNSEPAPSLADMQPDVDGAFAAIVDRCLRAAPEDRYPTAGALRSALEDLSQPVAQTTIPAGNPYRGLRAFEAEHAGLFFGRRSEIGTVLQRLRSDPMVVVTGDSGVGKSSLCRAGVLPLLDAGDIQPGLRWHIARMVPGRRPLSSLARAIADALEIDSDQVLAAVRAGKNEFSALLRQHLGQSHGLMLFVDQFEELATISDSDQLDAVCEVMSLFGARARQLRMLATVRGDFLVPVGNLPTLGELVTDSLYMLRPMSPDKVREAIVAPARVKGVAFESTVLIDELVRSATSSQGGLPLLQFALAELWDARVSDTAELTQAALQQIGGVAGALARHADQIISGLSTEETFSAWRMLMSLVTQDNTRARRSKDELIAEDETAAIALEALVHGRLLSVRETAVGPSYELAHEALLSGWGLLRSWLDSYAEQREARERLEQAVAEWNRLGGKRAGLWARQQLDSAQSLERKTLTPRERAFLDASDAALVRRRRVRLGALIAIPMLLVLAYAAQQKASQDAARDASRAAARELAEQVAGKLADARAERDLAEERAISLQAAREAAFAAYRAVDAKTAEHHWGKAVARYAETSQHFMAAGALLESALTLDGTRTDVQIQLRDVLSARAAVEESMYRYQQRDELLARMAMYDRDGSLQRQWQKTAQVHLITPPTAATVTIASYRQTEDGHLQLNDNRPFGTTPLSQPLTPGSYVLTLSAPERATIRYPVLIERGETLDLNIPLPRAAEIPEGFIYIPAGRFLFGSDEVEMVRRDFLEAAPMHRTHTGSYIIARHETTYRE